MKNVLTVAQIEEAVKELSKHKIEPIRYAAKDVRVIKSGFLKGMLRIRKGAKPRKNGKIRTYAMIISPANIPG